MSASKTQRESIRQRIHDNASLSGAYILMNALATIIACYGLIADSTAVVIGAMLIAMLLGPITGVALGLVDGDNRLLRKALLAEIAGVLVVLAVSFIIGKVHQDIALGKEIASRTSPNILDLIIALAGGAAGAYASITPRLSGSLVGVAIATALVPPLATCSILFARGETRLAAGGFLLFFANFVAIQFASSVVLWIRGYHQVTHRQQGPKSVLMRNAVSLGALIILTVVLGLNFKQSLAKQQLEGAIRSQLQQALHEYPGAFLADLRFSRDTHKRIVTATVRTPAALTVQQVSALESRLPDAEDLELHIRSVITTETTKDGVLYDDSRSGGEKSLQ